MSLITDKQHTWVKRDSLVWLLFAHSFTIFPLFLHLPFWIPLFWLISATWRVQIYRGAWPFPSNITKFILGALAILGLFLSYMGAMGVEPLVGFLVVSFVLKLLEVRQRSDYLLIIYVGFITVAAQFLFFQTIFIAIYGGISVIFLLCAWNTNYCSESVSLKKRLGSIGLLFLQSLPLMMALFIVLPRIGTLWHVPIPQKTGVTGFSETMSPGDFSALSQSRQVAFRVSFDAADKSIGLPPRSEWYWRGLVLDHFDGRSWRQKERFAFGRSRKRGLPDSWNLKLGNDNQNFRYSVLLEPHQQPWLFTLMAPVFLNSSSLDVFFAEKYLAKSLRPVASRAQYDVVSANSYLASPESLSPRLRRNNLRLPDNQNPRAIALVNEWMVDGLQGQALLDEILAYYRASFTYTLRPPALGRNSVDEFLFETQRGFCEHFSSSFVFLMRAAGVPARVVLGYQGGEYNPIENYIIVRQSDAHAWAEIWLEGSGWVRVDPTAAVSPSRIEMGLEESLGLEDQALLSSPFKLGFLSQLQLQFDALSFSWHRWVLSYNSEQQAGVLSQLLGGTEGWRVALFFLAFIAIFLFAYYLWYTLKVRPKHDYPEQKLFALFLKSLKKDGYCFEPGETPEGFSARMAGLRPDMAPQIASITALYSKIAYSEKRELLPLLKGQIAAFRKKPQRSFKPK